MKTKDSWTITEIEEIDTGTPQIKGKKTDLNQTRQKEAHGIVIDLSDQKKSKKAKKRRKSKKKTMHKQPVHQEQVHKQSNRKKASFSFTKRFSKLTIGEKVTGCALLLLFALGLLILAECQVITTLNHDISTEKTALETIQASNDSKNGQLLDKQDLSAIEATVREYGMTEPSADQYVYETEITEEMASADSDAQK